MISIETFVFNTFMVNAYLLHDETGEAVIVDPACADEQEEDQLTGFLQKHNLKLVKNINTHCHIDHILGNAFIEGKFGLKPEYHQASAPFFYTAKEIAVSFGYRIDHIPDAGAYLKDEEVIRWGTSELKVLYTPGHADGSICLYNEEQDFILTGDVLFRDSVGRTDLPTGNMDVLIASIREKIYSLPDETVVYPGHGPETEIGYEKQHNPFVR